MQVLVSQISNCSQHWSPIIASHRLDCAGVQATSHLGSTAVAVAYASRTTVVLYPDVPPCPTIPSPPVCQLCMPALGAGCGQPCGPSSRSSLLDPPLRRAASQLPASQCHPIRLHVRHGRAHPRLIHQDLRAPGSDHSMVLNAFQSSSAPLPSRFVRMMRPVSASSTRNCPKVLTALQACVVRGASCKVSGLLKVCHVQLPASRCSPSHPQQEIVKWTPVGGVDGHAPCVHDGPAHVQHLHKAAHCIVMLHLRQRPCLRAAVPIQRGPLCPGMANVGPIDLPSEPRHNSKSTKLESPRPCGGWDPEPGPRARPAPSPALPPEMLKMQHGNRI